MEIPGCETSPCLGKATVFHVFRQTFMCQAHAGVFGPKEGAALMPVQGSIAAFVCRFNNCSRPPKYKGVKNGDYFCATHTEGIPSQLVTDELGEPSRLVTVEVSLGTPGQFDLIPVTETANALGRKGLRVFDLSWKGGDPEGNRLLLHIEPFTGMFAQDDLTKRQINLLETRYNQLKEQLNVVARQATTNDGKYIQERDQNRALRSEISNMKEELEQSHRKLQHFLADGRQEDLSICGHLDLGDLE